MPHPGPKTGTPRTLRGIALSKGSAPAGFKPMAEYSKGAPVMPSNPAQEYKTAGPFISPTGPTPVPAKVKITK